VYAERALSRSLAGSCNVPLAGYAELAGALLRLRGYVGAPDGKRHVSAEVEGTVVEAESLGIALAAQLKSQGAGDILATLDHA
jgi:hydroxymethylbilane synthase